MMAGIVSKLKKDPLGLIKRGIFKVVIGPLRYGREGDYDAERYWHDRFSRYGVWQPLRGAGDEGLSEAENRRMYAEAAAVLVDLCQRERVDFQNTHVLEIGCGTGFYTKVMYDMGVQNYIGIDITDILLPDLRRQYPNFTFLKKDITLDPIEGNFDLIIMIDVIQHIVAAHKLSSAMKNIKNSLSERGVFIVAPISDITRKHLFYVNFWSLEDVICNFSGYTLGDLIPFRDSHILAIRKP